MAPLPLLSDPEVPRWNGSKPSGGYQVRSRGRDWKTHDVLQTPRERIRIVITGVVLWETCIGKVVGVPVERFDQRPNHFVLAASRNWVLIETRWILNHISVSILAFCQRSRATEMRIVWPGAGSERHEAIAIDILRQETGRVGRSPERLSAWNDSDREMFESRKALKGPVALQKDAYTRIPGLRLTLPVAAAGAPSRRIRKRDRRPTGVPLRRRRSSCRIPAPANVSAGAARWCQVGRRCSPSGMCRSTARKPRRPRRDAPRVGRGGRVQRSILGSMSLASMAL